MGMRRVIYHIITFRNFNFSSLGIIPKPNKTILNIPVFIFHFTQNVSISTWAFLAPSHRVICIRNTYKYNIINVFFFYTSNITLGLK